MTSFSNKTRIPFATIKRIMKEHTDCLVSEEAVEEVAEKTLEFIVKLTENSAEITKVSQRKIIQRDMIKTALKLQK